MDLNMKSSLIDTYDLNDCIAILAAYAPDLLAPIADDIRLRRDEQSTLTAARRAVHEALAIERKTN